MAAGTSTARTQAAREASGNGNGNGLAHHGNGNGTAAGVAPRKDIFGIVERNEQSYWTRIGVAFENRDGSWNVRLDYLPSRPDIKLQFRDPRERDAEAGESR